MAEGIRMIFFSLFLSFTSPLYSNARVAGSVISVINNAGVDPISVDEDAISFQDRSTDFVSLIDGFEESEDDADHQGVRTRRDLVFVGGEDNQKGKSNNPINTITASQSCEGVVVQWETSTSIPYSTKYRYTNAAFKYYEVYRSDQDFSDVADMEPYASGRDDKHLSLLHERYWVDKYPVIGKQMYYAVRFTAEDASSKVVTAKVTFLPAFESDGQSVFALRGVLRGKTLHHSLVYNPHRKEYLIAFDWDINSDGVPEHLYAIRQDVHGNVVDKSVLNFTASITSWRGGTFIPEKASGSGNRTKCCLKHDIVLEII